MSENKTNKNTMNKNTKIIIALSIAFVLTLTVLVVALVKKPGTTQAQTTIPPYTLQPTTVPNLPSVTESWVDLNLIASNLASTTDTSTTDTTATSAPIVSNPDYMNGLQNSTSIVYVDQFGNVIDVNQLLQNNTQPQNTTAVDKNELSGTVATTKDNEGKFSDFAINSNGVLTNYYGTSKTVLVPAEVNGRAVTAIGSNCFSGTSVESVYIPACVKSIGNYAFAECKNLKQVAFADKTVDVPIGEFAFKGCKSLKKMDLPISSSIGASAFEGCEALTSVDIKKGTKNISAHSFALCSSLTSVTIREEEATISASAFPTREQNSKLVVYCVAGSDVERLLVDFNLNTSPISN